jgi:hypothetical protein
MLQGLRKIRRQFALIALAVAVGVSPARVAQEATGEAAPPDAGPVDEPVDESVLEPPVPTPPAYRSPDDFERLFAAWRGTGLAERVELGVNSAGGRPLDVVQFGAPDGAPLSERPTILLVGGLDGVSLAGSEAVLAIVERLLAAPDALPAGVSFLAVPWGNPDALARMQRGAGGDGQNARSVDEDHDGRADEDGPDDLDGDGVILEMLLEDPAGPWVRAADGRFLRPARQGEVPRYRRVREGRDDDGDGRYNEDGPGGVSFDHNFPVGWEGPWCGVSSGSWPLSEPCSKALADLALSRPVFAVLLFQGNHGSLATPGARRGGVMPGMPLPLPAAEDGPAYLALTALLAETTSRKLSGPLRLVEARGREIPGAPLDWFYCALGALAAEVGVWGTQVEVVSRSVREARSIREGRFTLSGEDAADPFAGVAEAERAWAGWLDDTRGGIGFVDWQPVDLDDGRQALVGGWEPRTCLNPPADVLPRALEGLDAFVLGVAKRLPRLEIEVCRSSREGAVVRLQARVRNAGGLPSGVAFGGEDRRIRLRLEIPDGVVLLAGEAEIELDHLPGGGASRDLDWLFTAPEGTLLLLRAEAPLCGEVVREVRP